MSAELATELYAMLPRNLRHQLYTLMMNNPNNPFHDGPDDSFSGRWFIISTGDYPAPAAQAPLNQIVGQLPLTAAQREQMYTVYVRHLKDLLTDHLRRTKPANLQSFMQNANYKSRLTRVHGANGLQAEIDRLIGEYAIERRGPLIKAAVNAGTLGGGRRRRRRRTTRRSRKN
jgi:hypothetical protein